MCSQRGLLTSRQRDCDTRLCSNIDHHIRLTAVHWSEGMKHALSPSVSPCKLGHVYIPHQFISPIRGIQALYESRFEPILSDPPPCFGFTLVYTQPSDCIIASPPQRQLTIEKPTVFIHSEVRNCHGSTWSDMSLRIGYQSWRPDLYKPVTFSLLPRCPH